ncbi:hypothetical protein CsSME_00029365 [Camellia sinensis var. sinensis]
MRELWLEMWHDSHPDSKSKFVTKAKRGPLREDDCYWDYGKSYRLRNSSTDLLLHYL